MERNLYAKHSPFCSVRIAGVDQYMFDKKDNTERICENGVSHPIYGADGNISYTLPLEYYPPDFRQVHPDIAKSSFKPFFNARNAQTWNKFQTNYNEHAYLGVEDEMKIHYQRSNLYEGLYD